ncbi:MAG: hypothetical protein U0793_22380 [Gemmataceae bacterium]
MKRHRPSRFQAVILQRPSQLKMAPPSLAELPNRVLLLIVIVPEPS